jgi:hypothetical protein
MMGLDLLSSPIIFSSPVHVKQGFAESAASPRKSQRIERGAHPHTQLSFLAENLFVGWPTSYMIEAIQQIEDLLNA